MAISLRTAKMLWGRQVFSMAIKIALNKAALDRLADLFKNG
jgi:hypothetical protein